MRDPIIVEFGDPKDFIQELARHDSISWDQLRLTCVYRATGTLNFTTLMVVATAIVAAGGILLRLRHCVGELTGLDSDAKVRERAAAAMRLLDEAATRRGLEVRAGVFSTDRGM